MRAFVTGATGFIGSHVTRELLQEGHEVRALVRETSDLSLIEDLDVETVVGDVADPLSVREGMERCDTVFHLAGVVSFRPSDADLLHRVNVEGTYNIVEAAKFHDVDRLVHTASVAALGHPEGGEVADEETEFNWQAIGIPYMATKNKGQRIVLGNAEKGMLDAVVVNPSTLLGPGDKNKNGGQFIRTMLKGHLPGVPGGGQNFGDVRDAARGHILAYEKGHSGENYILGGENLSWRAFYDLVEDVTGHPAPKRTIPYPLAYAGAWWAEVRARFTNRPAFPTRKAVKAAYMDLHYSSAKARKELGYTTRPLDASIRDTVRWYREHGYL